MTQWVDKILSLVLTESTGKDFAKRFFDLRGSSFLKTINLKTGENLRWFPQWPPRYADAEGECARILEIILLGRWEMPHSSKGRELTEIDL